MAVSTAARITHLVALIANIDAIQLDMTSCPKPTYTVDAQTFKWTEYFEMLTEQRLKALAEHDALVDIQDGAGFETGQAFVEV